MNSCIGPASLSLRLEDSDRKLAEGLLLPPKARLCELVLGDEHARDARHRPLHLELFGHLLGVLRELAIGAVYDMSNLQTSGGGRRVWHHGEHDDAESRCVRIDELQPERLWLAGNHVNIAGAVVQ